MKLSAHGIQIELPRGWEGRIYRRSEGDPTLHAANFALPADDGDFGTGALGSMRTSGAFIVLTEYDPAVAGHGLFAQRGLPLPLEASEASAAALLRQRRGQSGIQKFFTASGRAFCLYVVVGSDPGVETLMRDVNRVLTSVSIQATPSLDDAT